MDKDILEMLSRCDPEFSRGQRRIASYIIKNFDKVALMTAGKLAQETGVSESTVVRFATELGFDGYPGLRKALRELARSKLTSVQRIEAARATMDTENVVESVMNSDMENLHSTIHDLNREDFHRAVTMVTNAEHVYIVAMRSSTCLASFLGYYFSVLLDNVHVIQDTALSEVSEQIMRIHKGDVFIGISYPRYSSRTYKAMEFAKHTGAETVAITDSAQSPLAALADVVLYAHSDMVSFLDSLTAPMSLINALIIAVGIETKNDIEDTFKTLESIWRDCEVYQ